MSRNVLEFEAARLPAVDDWSRTFLERISASPALWSQNVEPRPVEFTFVHQNDLSGPSMQVFSVESVTVVDPDPARPTDPAVEACLEGALGTTLMVACSGEALPSSGRRFRESILIPLP